MTWIETLAAVLGLACVTLVVRRSIWNYAFGIASTALLGIVFFEARLYSDTLLQAFFVVVNGYGWWSWRRARALSGAIVVERMTGIERLGWLVGWAGAVAVWGTVMHRYTDASYPWPDAAIAIAGVVAQVLMAQRRLENWVVWIAVDIASIPLYAAKGLWLTTALYSVYLAMALWGYVDWRRVRRGTGPVVA